jgi:thiol-disulfide isomerase/thioredoxin
LWLDCLIWIGVDGVPGPDFDGMIDFMQSHAAEVENTTQLMLFMSELIPLESDRLNPALGEIAKQHPNTSVRGAALYALAARTKMLAEREGSQEGCKSAMTLLQQVVAEFPDVRTYRGQNKKNAERLLRELQSPVAIGKTAVETKGKSLDGSPFDLADHRGKVVVLSFSGHWCGPCVAMHSIEKQLLDTYTREELAIIEINSDNLDNLESVTQKIEKDGLHWQMVADGPGGPLSKSWNVTAWPTFCVLDRTHRIRRRDVGYIGGKLTDWVDELISESSEN